MLMWLFPLVGLLGLVFAMIVSDLLEELLRAVMPWEQARNVASFQALMLLSGLLGAAAAAGLRSLTLAAVSLVVLVLNSLTMGVLILYVVARVRSLTSQMEKAKLQGR